MIAAARTYIRFVEAVNLRVGRVAMYGVFAMMAVLLWSSLSKTFLTPSLWTLETAQFLMVAYYILGGPYSIQLGSNVRMDLFYGGWSTRRKAWFDAVTVLFLMYFLGVLLHGGVSSMAYSLGHWGDEPYSFLGSIVWGFLTGGVDGASEIVGRAERSPTAWRPYLWPIKLVMLLGFVLMLLQASAELLKDIATLRGHDWRGDGSETA